MSSTYLNNIEEILLTHDPMRLIASGAPRDEYHEEAIKIANIKFNTHEELTNEIIKIFTKSFSPDMIISEDEYKIIADEILRMR